LLGPQVSRKPFGDSEHEDANAGHHSWSLLHGKLQVTVDLLNKYRNFQICDLRYHSNWCTLVIQLSPQVFI